MHTTTPSAALPQGERPRRAVRIARFYMGEDYDEEAVAAEVVVALYTFVYASIGVGVGVILTLTYRLTRHFLGI